MIEVSVTELRDVVGRELRAHGVADDDAAILIDYIVDTESAGHRTHGLRRLTGMLTATAKTPPSGPVQIRRTSPGVIALDGCGRLGVVVAQRCTDLAIDEARLGGSAMVVATGFRGSTGALGYFTRQAALRGLVALMVASCESGVAAEGGIDPALGTNPLAVSFPHDRTPITLDMATSAVSYGTLQEMAAHGIPAPPSTVVDAAGRPSCDARDALTGAQLPMAAHKGYGLALLIELLAGPMIGGKAGRSATPGSDGLVMVATRVDHFRMPNEIAEETARLLAEIRAGRRRDPDEPIRIPGERSEHARIAAERSGRVLVDELLWRDTRRRAERDE